MSETSHKKNHYIHQDTATQSEIHSPFGGEKFGRLSWFAVSVSVIICVFLRIAMV